jgi:hypothetical protein
VQDTDIPTKIIKENIDIFSDFFHESFNECIKSSKFPANLKNANIIPIFKKGTKNLKENYRPISILPNSSKLFERPLFNQMSHYFDKIFSKYQCGFRKGFKSQDSLLSMLENWRKSSDKGEAFGALLTDLSKAFDCLSHELLIAKLHAYGFTLPSLKLIYSYLKGRKQRTKINNSYSSWEEIIFGVPQGSILGPLLFNIFICDLFIILCDYDFASYADDNTPYVCGKNMNEVISSLENVSLRLFKWFTDNEMKANPEKCHLLLNTQSKWTLNIENVLLESSSCEKLLGIKIDNELNFDTYLTDICKKASNKIHAISRIAPYMNFAKKRNLMNAFFSSQFNYCPLIWMCHSRTLNNKINNLHERCLRIIYNDKASSFETLLEKDNSVTVHCRNIQYLAIEMYKVFNARSPIIVSQIFPRNDNNHYNTRNFSDFIVPCIKTVHYGTETISYLGPKVWDIIPSNIKEKQSLQSFKIAIKTWKAENCPCRLCKIYLPGVGFIVAST